MCRRPQDVGNAAASIKGKRVQSMSVLADLSFFDTLLG
jgi:hypothetical protein